MDRVVGAQQCTQSNSHPLNRIIGVAYDKLFCLRSFWCAGWCILSTLNKRTNPCWSTCLGGKNSHTVWRVVETMSALFVALCLTLKGENPGDFRDVRDAVFVFFIKVQKMVVWFLSAFHRLQSQMFPDVFKTREKRVILLGCAVFHVITCQWHHREAKKKGREEGKY